MVPLVNYRHSVIQRNKRCALAYLYNRLQKLKELRWNFGPILNADMKASLCESEIQWFNNYSQLLTNYQLSLSNDLKINLVENAKPPKTLFIEVRSLVDYGKLELADGEIVNLKKNSQHYLPRIQCEQLIRQGVLQHLE
jgi:GINS complex subunit 1